MPRRKIQLRHRKQRAVLTDMLPFEVPPTFTNKGFYRFLREHSVELEEGRLSWEADSASLDPAIRLLFGIDAATIPTAETVTAWGSTKKRRAVPLGKCRMDTIPFNFRVSHKLDGRVLTVPHPRNQVAVAAFYANHAALITYYSSLSGFSIRHPVSVSRYAFFKDSLHEQRLETIHSGVEEEEHEYEQLGSYFVYKKYRNIHRFFESYKYHRCEKKYNAMVQIDVNKCFDSIYTHSLPWAVLGRQQTKFSLKESTSTFAGRFDSLMQGLNQKETNGIIIGPEFSRVFAEIILQAADIELERKLHESANLIHKTHYEIFRYVDDYFIFYNEDSDREKITETLQAVLKERKLSINSSKLKIYQKPIITEITIGKERISSLLNDEIAPQLEPDEDAQSDKGTVSCLINSNRLIVRFKAAIKESHVEYGDLLNYTFAILEKKLAKLTKIYTDSHRSKKDQARSVDAMVAVLEFAFFAYSASPKVNHTIRVCRMISSCVDLLKAGGFSYDMKHLLYKYVHENVMQQLEKNTMGLYREIESLYLLISLSEIGKEYWLPEATLARHFVISKKDDGNYERADFLSHFSITVLLSYIKDKSRYDALRQFIEAHSIEKLQFVKAHCPNDSEALMLVLDLAVCPYIAPATISALGATFGLSAGELTAVQAANDQWFTAWGKKFDLGKELDAKRSREVY